MTFVLIFPKEANSFESGEGHFMKISPALSILSLLAPGLATTALAIDNSASLDSLKERKVVLEVEIDEARGNSVKRGQPSAGEVLGAAGAGTSALVFSASALTVATTRPDSSKVTQAKERAFLAQDKTHEALRKRYDSLSIQQETLRNRYDPFSTRPARATKELSELSRKVEAAAVKRQVALEELNKAKGGKLSSAESVRSTKIARRLLLPTASLAAGFSAMAVLSRQGRVEEEDRQQAAIDKNISDLQSELQYTRNVIKQREINLKRAALADSTVKESDAIASLIAE